MKEELFLISLLTGDKHCIPAVTNIVTVSGAALEYVPRGSIARWKGMCRSSVGESVVLRTEVAALVPGQGSYKCQPVSTYISGTTNQCFSQINNNEGLNAESKNIRVRRKHR